MEPFANYKSNLFLNLILVYILWGSTYLGVKIGLNDLTPILLTACRFIIGGAILFLFTFVKKPRVEKDELIGSAKIGMLLSGIGTAAIAYGIIYIPSGLVAVLVAMLPVAIFILDYSFFSKQAPSVLSSLGMTAGVIGVLFLFNPFGEQNDHFDLKPFPVFIVGLGTLSWAYGSLLSSKTKQLKGMQGIAVQMFAGGVLALILSFVFEKNQLSNLSTVGPTTMLAMAYLIFIGSYLGYTSYVWLINNAPPLLTSTYAFVNPVVAIILGIFLAKEILDRTTIIACAIILIGVILMTLGRRKKNYETK